MRQATQHLDIDTQGKGLYSFTEQISQWVNASGMQTGLLTIFVKHTSASLLIQENYDPDVQSDLERFFSRLVPEGDAIYDHVLEGPDDMPAHVRAALTQTHLAVPVIAGMPALGTWQGVYLYEHRTEPQRRQVLLHLIGE